MNFVFVFIYIALLEIISSEEKALNDKLGLGKTMIIL